jgi:uncharacterized protein (DUF1330 family)
MAAYVISEVEMLDETQGRRYRELAAGSIARHGGRYLVRGAAPVVAEGDWPPGCRVVIVEFPTMERLQAWYASAEGSEEMSPSAPARSAARTIPAVSAARSCRPSAMVSPRTARTG